MAGIANKGIAVKGIARHGIAHLGIGGFPRGVLSPADPDSIIQRFREGVEPDTTNVINDLIGTLDDANYVGNNCLLFDGVDDYITLTTPRTTAVGDEIEILVKLITNPDGASGDHRGLISNGGVGYIAIKDNNSGEIIVRGDSIQTATTKLEVSDGWTYLKVVIDSTSQVTLYKKALGESYGAGESLSLDFTGLALDEIGRGTSGLTRYTNMNVAYCKIGPYIYTFAEGSGVTVYDTSDNDNPGTINGATWTTDDDAPAHNIENGYSTNVVGNYSFDSSSGWTVFAGASISNGVATLSGASASIQRSIVGLINGETVTVTYEITRYEAGVGNLYLSGSGFSASTSIPKTVGKHSVDVTVTDENGPLRIITQTTATFEVDIDWVTVDVGATIPALADGSADVIGNEITNPGGYVHNGAESLMRQSASVFATNAPNRWHDGAAFLDVSWADILAYLSGDKGSWQRFETTALGVCLLEELTQYEFTWAPTPSEYLRNKAYFRQSSCGAGILVPLQSVEGGIGPDSDWFTYDGTHILLVEDA